MNSHHLTRGMSWALHDAVLGLAVLATIGALCPGLRAQTPEVTFAAIGDMGTGGPGQRQVARTMAAVAKSRPFDFVITLGDNFYGSGVLSVTDPQWKSKFEEMYGDPALQVPFYPTLGNHDHHSVPLAQVEYSRHSDRWHMPAQYYTFTRKTTDGTAVAFFAIDTPSMQEGTDGTEAEVPLDQRLAAIECQVQRGNLEIGEGVAQYIAEQVPRPGTFTFRRIFILARKMQREVSRDLVDEALRASDSDYVEQIRWLDEELSKSEARWKIVYGHYPPYGHHPVRQDNETLIERLVPVLVKGGVDLYIAGHDHFLDMLKPIDGVHYVTSGAAAASDNPYPIEQTDESYFAFTGGSFTVYRVSAGELVIDFIGAEGEALHSQVLKK